MRLFDVFNTPSKSIEQVNGDALSNSNKIWNVAIRKEIDTIEFLGGIKYSFDEYKILNLNSYIKKAQEDARNNGGKFILDDDLKMRYDSLRNQYDNLIHNNISEKEEILKEEEKKEHEADEKIYKEMPEIDMRETNIEYIDYYVQKYSDQILKYGYSNFKVEIGESLQYVHVLVCDEEDSYILKCRCYSKDLTSEKNERAFCDIIDFLRKYEEMTQCNAEELIIQHLNDKFFYDVHVAQYTERTVSVFAYKNQIKYAITIYIDCIPDSVENKILSSAEYAKYYIHKYSEQLYEFGYSTFEIEIGQKLQNIDICLHHKKGVYNFKCRCYSENLLYEDNECAFGEIIAFLKEINETIQDKVEVQLLQHLEYKNFEEIHVAQGTEHTISVFAFKNNIKYAITIYADFLIDSHMLDEIVLLDDENEIVDFDNLEGHQFEFFCADILARNGYDNVTVTQGSGDQGIDIIAYRDDIKYGIQCKCYTSPIGNKAVQEVFAGKTFYQCHVGIVLTNNYFTSAAIELAQRNGIILWNRDKLLQMIQNGK